MSLARRLSLERRAAPLVPSVISQSRRGLAECHHIMAWHAHHTGDKTCQGPNPWVARLSSCGVFELNRAHDSAQGRGVQTGKGLSRAISNSRQGLWLRSALERTFQGAAGGRRAVAIVIALESRAQRRMEAIARRGVRRGRRRHDGREVDLKGTYSFNCSRKGRRRNAVKGSEEGE